MRKQLKNGIFRLARGRFGDALVGFVCAHGHQLLPGVRLAETETLMVIPHPVPSYSFHALILPKRRIADFPALLSEPVFFETFATDIALVLSSLGALAGLSTVRIVLNGGARQDVRQLHLHVISDGATVDGIPLPDGDGSVAMWLCDAANELTQCDAVSGYSIQARAMADGDGHWHLGDGKIVIDSV